MLAKLADWIFYKGWDRGYNEALRDVALAMSAKGRKLEDLEWELELLRLA